MNSHLEDVDDLSFEHEVLGSELPYLLDFSAVWCGPCRALQPILEELAAEYRGRLRIGKLDVDQSPLVASRLGVRGAPTLVLFRGGKEQARQLGLTTKPRLRALLNGVASPA